MRLSQQPAVAAVGASNLAALSLQEDATTNTFSSLDTNEAAIYRLRFLSNWSMPRLLAFLYSENGQTEIQEAFQLNEKSDLARQCIGIVGFGQLLLVGWRVATSVDCGEGGVHDYVHDVAGSNPSSSLAETRKPKENFMEFCSVQMKVIGSIALSCACDADGTRLSLLEACSEVLCEVLMAYARPVECDPVDAMLAGVGPPHPGSTTIYTRTHRSVSLLPMVRGALEGLLFLSSTSTSSGGGVGISPAGSSSSHVLQGQGQVYPSPLHLWLTSWRRSSSSSPLSRLVSNLLITLLHEQRRHPGSMATTLHVPHIGPSSFDARPSASLVLPPPSSSPFTSSLALGTYELALVEEETADARAGDAWLNIPHTLSIAAAAAEWLEVALVPMMQRVGARARPPGNNNNNNSNGSSSHAMAGRGGKGESCFAQAAYGAMEDALELCCCIIPPSSFSSSTSTLSSSSQQPPWVLPPSTVIQASSHVVTNALRLFKISVKAGNTSSSSSGTSSSSSRGQPPNDPVDFLRSVRCRLVGMAILAVRNATAAATASATVSSSSLSPPSPSQICELFECCCRIAIEVSDKDNDNDNCNNYHSNTSSRGSGSSHVTTAVLLITEICVSMLLPMPRNMSNDDDDDGDEEEKDDVHWEDGAPLCLLRAVLQEPWMTKALQHNNNNTDNNNRATPIIRATSSPSTDAFSFRIAFVIALCQGLGVALTDALAHLLTRSPDPSDRLTQRSLTGLRRCVVAVMVLLGRVVMDHCKGEATGGGGGRGVNGQTTAAAALDDAADDGNDGLRLHPPVLRKLGGQGHSIKSNQETASSSSSLAFSLSSMRRTVDAIVAFLTNHRGGDNSTATTATTAAASLAIACHDLAHLIDRTMMMVTADAHLEGNEGVLPHHHQVQMGPSIVSSMAAVIDQAIQQHRVRYHRHPHPHRDDRDSNGNSDSYGSSGTSAGANNGSNNNSLGLLADGDGDGLFWRQMSGSADPLSALMCAHYLPHHQGLGRGLGLDDRQPMVRVLVRVINSAGFKLDACTLRLEVFSSPAFTGTGTGTKDMGVMTTDSSSTGGGGTSMVGMASSCVIMEDHYHQQQQYHQPTQTPQRDDNSNSSGGSSGGGNVVMMEYWQPGVAVEKVYHLQLRRFAAIRAVLRIGYRHPVVSTSAIATSSALELSPMDFFQTDYNNTNTPNNNNNGNNGNSNGALVSIHQKNVSSAFASSSSSSSSSSLITSECDCAPLHIGVAQQLLPYHTSHPTTHPIPHEPSYERHERTMMAGAVPLAVFQALWEGLPCTGVLPVTTTSSTKTVTTTRGLLQGVSDCIDHHVLLCTGQDQGIAQGQGLPEAAVLGLPVVGMACRVQHQHPHYHGGDGMGAFGSMDDEEEEVRRRMSAGPMVAWAMQTLWGKGVAVRIDARARDRARDRDRAGDRADWGELVMEIRCADEHTLAAILADAPAFVEALTAGVLRCAL